MLERKKEEGGGGTQAEGAVYSLLYCFKKYIIMKRDDKSQRKNNCKRYI